MPHPVRYLTGRRFGRLLVVHRETGRPVTWRCRCACGAFTTATSNDLRNGKKSCGCWRRDRMRERNRSGETWRARRAS